MWETLFLHTLFLWQRTISFVEFSVIFKCIQFNVYLVQLQNLYMYWKRKALTPTNVNVYVFFYYLTLKSVNLIKDKNALGIYYYIYAGLEKTQRLLAQCLT